MWFAGCSDRNEGIGGPKDGVAIAFSLDCGALSASVGAAQTGQPAQVAPIAQTAAQTALATRAAVPIANGTTVRIVALHAGDALGSTPAASATYYVTGEETADGHKRAVLAPCTVTNDATGAVTAYSDDPTKVMRLKAGEYDFYAFSPALPLKSDGKSVDVYHGMDFAASATAGVVVKSDGSTTYPDPMNAAPATKNGAIGRGAVELQTLERKCSKLVFTVSPKVTTENGTSWSSVRQAEFKVVRVFKLPKSPVSAVVPDDIASADQVPMTTDVSTITNPADFAANGIFELAASDFKFKIYKAVEIDDLVLNRYMNVTPNVITVGVREIVSSMQYEGSFDIDIESNIGQINLTSANWTSGNDPLYLEIVKPDGSAVAVTVPATFSMESDYPDGELKLRVHYTDLNTSNIDFWDTSHTGSGAFKLRLGVDNEGFTGDDYVNPSTVTVNTVASNDNYIIHFKPGAPWSRAGTDAVQPHIYIYQCLAMPANLTAITGNEYDAQFASKTVGYYDYGMKAALEYSFTGKIAFKGWDNESNLTALKGTKSMDGGFVKLESAKLNIKDNDAANHYYFDYDFMDSYRNGKDIYGHYKCDCENCRKEYANQPGEDNGYNRMWPGIMMEKEPGTDGWWKIELTGIADPGKTLMMWRDGHAMNDGNNGDWAHNRYPKDNEPGVPLFDYPSREGWFDWESKTFLPENPDNRPYDWKSTAVNGMGRIYFENPSGWNPPYVHYWGGASNSSWPGKAMQQDGNGNWYYDIPIGTTGLVFSNNGNNQTPDIDINDEYNTYNSTEATKVTSK